MSKRRARVAVAAALLGVLVAGPAWARQINEIDRLPYPARSLAIDGDRLAIGSGDGNAWVYDVASGSEITTLSAGDPNNELNFGNAIDISGDRVVVGAWKGIDGVGAAYLFDAVSGAQVERFGSDLPKIRDDFGASVSINNGRVAVASRSDDAVCFDCGAAYLYSAGTGERIDRLPQSRGPLIGRRFGQGVGLRDDSLVLRSSSYTYLFDLGTGLHRLAHIDPISFFTGAIATDERYVVVGAGSGTTAKVIDTENLRRSNPGIILATGGASGSADSDGFYLFDTFDLAADDSASSDLFGASVAIDGNTAIVGAPSHSGGAGAAYVFDLPTGQQLAKLTASDAAAGDNFGFSVAIADGKAYVGSVRDLFSDDKGAVYVFDLSAPAGDYNGDGRAWLADHTVWSEHYGTADPEAGDGNRDGVVDAADYTLWRDAYLPRSYDYDRDGWLDEPDQSLWEDDYGRTGDLITDGNGDGRRRRRRLHALARRLRDRDRRLPVGPDTRAQRRRVRSLGGRAQAVRRRPFGVSARLNQNGKRLNANAAGAKPPRRLLHARLSYQRQSPMASIALFDARRTRGLRPITSRIL